MAEIAYDVHGPEDAPVLVLSPSLGTAMGMWEPQLAAFAERFRVVRVGHRGHSPDLPVPPGPYSIPELAGDVLDLLDGLGVDRFAACGLSLGGMLGMWAASHTDRVTSLALCCTSPHMPPPEGWTDRAATVRAEGMSAIVEATMERWFTPEFTESNPVAVKAQADALLAVPPEGYAGCCEALAEMDLRDDLASITAPTVVIAGSEDPSTPAGEHGDLIVAGVPNATMHVVDDAAHLATVQQPDVCTQILLSHLENAR